MLGIVLASPRLYGMKTMMFIDMNILECLISTSSKPFHTSFASPVTCQVSLCSILSTIQPELRYQSTDNSKFLRSNHIPIRYDTIPCLWGIYFLAHTHPIMDTPSSSFTFLSRG